MQINLKRTERELLVLLPFVSSRRKRTVPARSWGNLLMEVLAGTATATKERKRARARARRGGRS